MVPMMFLMMMVMVMVMGMDMDDVDDVLDDEHCDSFGVVYG